MSVKYLTENKTPQRNNVIKYSSEIYKNKVIKEFENILIENELQCNQNLKFEEMK